MAVVAFSVLSNEIAVLDEICYQNTLAERRRILSVQLGYNVRGYINTANNLGRNDFSLTALNEIIERKTYQRQLIMAQQQDLQSIHNYLMSQRSTENAKRQKEFEYQFIDVMELDEVNHIISIKQAYRQALNGYLNDVLMLNTTDSTLLYFPDDLILTAPKPSDTRTFNRTTLVQKQAYKIMVNGVRSLRVFTDKATSFQVSISFSSLAMNSFLAIFIVCLLIIIGSVSLIFFSFSKIEKI